jgi:uncharacterized Tic20 family protein
MNDRIPLKFRALAAGLHVFGAIPVLSVLITPILWTIVKEIHPFVDQSGKDAINYALNTFVGMMATLAFSMFVFSVTCGIGNQDPTLVLLSLLLFCCVSIVYFLNSIVAAIFALRGYSFNSRLIYPFIRF